MVWRYCNGKTMSSAMPLSLVDSAPGLFASATRATCMVRALGNSETGRPAAAEQTLCMREARTLQVMVARVATPGRRARARGRARGRGGGGAGTGRPAAIEQTQRTRKVRTVTVGKAGCCRTMSLCPRTRAWPRRWRCWRRAGGCYLTHPAHAGSCTVQAITARVVAAGRRARARGRARG